MNKIDEEKSLENMIVHQFFCQVYPLCQKIINTSYFKRLKVRLLLCCVAYCCPSKIKNCQVIWKMRTFEIVKCSIQIAM